MTDAAQEHLTTVLAATSEAETLTGETGNLRPAIEAAAAQVITALTTLAEAVGTVNVQAGTTAGATAQARNAAEAHTEAAMRLGHGTVAYAEAAKDACDSADASAIGLTEEFETLLGAVEEAKTAATTPLLALLSHTETLTSGARTVLERLGDAQTQITAAIHA